MSYQRKSLGSPCAHCGAAVETEAVAVRTLTRTLPYTPKIWHRGCFEARQAAAAPAATANAPRVRVACGVGASARAAASAELAP